MSEDKGASSDSDVSEDDSEEVEALDCGRFRGCVDLDADNDVCTYTYKKETMSTNLWNTWQSQGLDLTRYLIRAQMRTHLRERENRHSSYGSHCRKPRGLVNYVLCVEWTMVGCSGQRRDHAQYRIG
jgi:hypothetical protein